MKLIYFLSVKIYSLLIYIAAPFNSKANKAIKGRKNIFSNLEKYVDKNEKYIWVHAASLGEFEQARPLMELIKKTNPKEKIMLSFFSPSGYEVQKNYKYADIVTYMAFDSNKNAKKLLNSINIKCAFFVKYEFWYFHIHNLNKNNIPVYLISAIFRKSQLFFKPYGRFYRNILKNYEIIFLQNNESKHLLENYGITNNIVCGDTRADRVLSIANEEFINKKLEDFTKSSFTIVAGSTWMPDEDLLLKLLSEKELKIKFIIAPHEVSNKNINRLLENNNSIKYSEIDACNNIEDFKIIIIDSIGLLSKLYRYANLAYVGGGFGKGIHNTLEAAVYGVPVLFGPNNKKFNEAQELKRINAGFEISKYNELLKIVSKLYNTPSLSEKIKEDTCEWFNKSKGAVSVIYENTLSKQV